MRRSFYRNVRARDDLELFLVSAVSSLLLLRFYLYLAGYPQVGGGTLHIAHMLWGGVLMLGAIALSLLFLGRRVQRLTALIGGIGFGIFIDELGKFITKDNDYFFRPTIGIIYAVFVVLYLGFSFLTRHQRLHSSEYQLNALLQLEEVIARDMDSDEQAKVLELLRHADQRNAFTKQLTELVRTIKPVAGDRPGPFSRWAKHLDTWYARAWGRQHADMTVQFISVGLIILFSFGAAATMFQNLHDILDVFTSSTSYSHFLLLGEVVSAAGSAVLALWGIFELTSSHLEAFERFRQAVLVNLFLTEFFVFSREQFGAMPGFIGNLLLLLAITFVMHQERRLLRRQQS